MTFIHLFTILGSNPTLNEERGEERRFIALDFSGSIMWLN